MNNLKKTSCFLTSLILCLGLCGCNSNDKSSSKVESVVETTEQETTEAVTKEPTETKIMTYSDSPYNIYAYFKENLNFIGDYIEYDENTDPNESLGKEGSYIAKLNFELNYIQPDLSITPDLGASIEIFNNLEDAQKRSDYLNNLSFTKDQGNFVCGNIVLRITEQAKAKDMSSLREAFLEFMQSPKKYEKTTESQNELNDHFTVNNVEFDINKSWKHVKSDNNYYWYADDNSFITFTVIQSSISDSDKSDSYLNDLARAIAIEADNFTNQESIKINDKYDAIKFNCEINNVQAIMCVFVIDDKNYSISATTNLGSGDTIMNHYIDKVIESIKINKTEKEKPLNSTTEKPTEKSTPIEYTNALINAKIYSDEMHMSKAAIHDQLTSEYGDQFSEEAADYAVENLEADYKYNALQSAKIYQDELAMSPNAIYDQLISDYGEQFTEEEAQYAIDNLN